jgi:hypothetical protein
MMGRYCLSTILASGETTRVAVIDMKQVLLWLRNVIGRQRMLPSNQIQIWSVRIRWPSGLVIEDVEPVKEWPSANILNRMGRVVLKGSFKGKPVKLYEATNATHAKFIQHVSGNDQVSEFFPAIIDRSDHFVAAEWSQGSSMAEILKQQPDSNLLKCLVAVQVRFHSVLGDPLLPTGFDYWHDYLRGRFLNGCSLLGCSEFGADVCKQIDTAWAQGPKVLMHPDLTPANAIVVPPEPSDIVQNKPEVYISGVNSAFVSQSFLKVIDNELLCVGSMPLIDVCNSVSALFGLSPSLAASYVDLYLEESGRKNLSENELKAVSYMWLARQIGALIVSGKIRRAQAIIEEFTAGKNILPWSINN